MNTYRRDRFAKLVATAAVAVTISTVVGIGPATGAENASAVRVGAPAAIHPVLPPDPCRASC